jgi:hypothetical protein
LLPRFLLIHDDDRPARFSLAGVEDRTIEYWTSLLSWCYEKPLIHDEEGFIKYKILRLNDDSLSIWKNDLYDNYAAREVFLDDHSRVFIPKLRAYYSLKFAGILHCLKSYSGYQSYLSYLSSDIEVETIRHAMALTDFFAGQAVKASKLYKELKTHNEIEKRIIKTLHNLQCIVERGKLSVSAITEEYNDGLPEPLKLTPKKVGYLLRKIGLDTEKGNHNLSFLLWEQSKIEKLFSDMKVTKLTKVTQAGDTEREEVTNVTFAAKEKNIDAGVLDLTGDDWQVIE